MNKSTSPRDREFRKIIEGHIAISGLTKTQIAENLGMTLRGFLNWMNCPGMFRLTELRRLCDMIHVSKEDRDKLI